MSSKGWWIAGGVVVSVVVVKGAQSYWNPKCTKHDSKGEEPGEIMLEIVIQKTESVKIKEQQVPLLLEMVTPLKKKTSVSKVKQMVNARTQSVMSKIKEQTRGAWSKIKTSSQTLWNRFLNYIDGGRFEAAQAEQRRLSIENMSLSDKNERLSIANVNLREKNEDLGKGCDVARAAQVTAESTSQSAQARIRCLEEEIDNANAEAQARIRCLEEERDKANAEAASLRQSKERLEAEAENDERTILRLAERFCESKEERDKANAEAASLRQRIESLEARAEINAHTICQFQGIIWDLEDLERDREAEREAADAAKAEALERQLATQQ